MALVQDLVSRKQNERDWKAFVRWHKEEHGFEPKARTWRTHLEFRRWQVETGRIPLAITDKRFNNLTEAFPEVDWQRSKTVPKNVSYGDRIQWIVPGVFKDPDLRARTMDISFTYTWKAPGGGMASFKVFKAGKRVAAIWPAPFKDAERVWAEVMQVVASLMEEVGS